jgi:hypothetical protein
MGLYIEKLKKRFYISLLNLLIGENNYTFKI